MPDTATYDLETDVGKVRLLCSDLPDSDDPAAKAVFTDQELQTFLALRGGVVQLAAATALRSLGGNYVQVRGRLTMLDARTDAPAEARSLSEIADQLEREVDEAGAIHFVVGDV